MKLEEFITRLKSRGLNLTEEQVDQLNTYSSFLTEYNQKINLTAIVEYEDILEKHFYDSLLLAFNKEIHGSLVDVGTGAGFPGVVIKICFPEVKVTLLEPLQKRCIFLNQLIEKLKLKDIEVINVRGEDFSIKNREKYDFVTARAVTNLNNLIEICGAMVKVDGYFIALRGSSGIEEIENAKNAITKMNFCVENTVIEKLSDDSTRIISYFKKIGKTSRNFPRKYSTIKAQSL